MRHRLVDLYAVSEIPEFLPPGGIRDPKAFPSLNDCPEEGSREFEAELDLIQKEYVQLTCDAFQRPAESLDGVLAKARLAYRISVDMEDTEGPVEDMTPPDCPELDHRMLLWSILRDLERLVS